MKKLKKLLSFVLAMTMILSSGVVSVGAASYTDEKDIECLEAVQTLSELNIMVGKEGGRFDPNGTVTRAEMAKMLYVLANGGVDDGAVGYPNSGFTDIKGTWGENYINAAYALGLTAGVGNNKFGPNQTVTAAQVYKMLLNLVGYEDERAGMTGSEWAQNALRLAIYTGLNEDINVNYNEGMPRQYAAQAIYNAIDTYRVKIDDTGAYVEYDKTDAQPTVGEKYLRLETIEGVYAGNDETSISGDPESDGYIRIIEVEDGEETGKTYKLKSDAGTELLGEIVKVMYKTERNGTDKIAFGMYSTGDSTVEPFSIVDDYDVDDLENKKSKDAVVYVNSALVLGEDADDIEDKERVTIGGMIDDGDVLTLPDSAYLRLVYNDGLKKEDSNETSDYNALAFVTVPVLNEITTYSSSTLTFADSIVTDIDRDGDFEWTKSFDLDDNDIEYDIADDVEEDDVVVVYYNAQGDVLHVEKAESVTGEVTGIRGSDELRVDGEWYSYDGDKMVDFCSYVDDDDFTEPKNIKTGTTYTLYLVNGFYVAAEKGDGRGSSNDDYAIVTSAYAVGEDLRLKLLTADGLEKTYTIGEFCDEDVDDISDVDELADDIKSAIKSGAVIVSYSISNDKADIDGMNIEIGGYQGDDLGDDCFELTKSSDKLFYKESTGTVYGKNGTKSFSEYLDTEAAIFFDEGKGDDWEAYEYDALDDDIDMDDLWQTNTEVWVVMEDDEVVCLAVFNAGDAPSASTSGVHYGYVTKKPVDNGDTIEYTIWDGTDLVEYERDEASASASRDDFIAYTIDSDDMIDDIYVIMDSSDMQTKEFKEYTIAFGYISDVSGSRVKTRVFTGFEIGADKKASDLSEGDLISCTTTSDSLLMTVDSDNRKGVDGTTKLRKNNQVIIVVNEDDEIEFAVIDTNGYFKKGDVLKNFLTDDEYKKYYQNSDGEGITISGGSTDVEEECAHKNLTYKQGNSVKNYINVTCSDCDELVAEIAFTYDAEAANKVKVSFDSNELGLTADEVLKDCTFATADSVITVTYKGANATVTVPSVTE